jgi:amidophosphoribosyltransferase
MAKLGSFIAFRAAEDLHKERGTYDALFHEVYELAKADLESNNRNVINHVKRIFDPFSDKELSDRIAQLLKPADLDIEVEIIYQSVEGLHSACPNHLGDWYFTGNYPTPGGMRVVNKAFVYHMEGNPNRAY